MRMRRRGSGLSPDFTVSAAASVMRQLHHGDQRGRVLVQRTPTLLSLPITTTTRQHVNAMLRSTKHSIGPRTLLYPRQVLRTLADSRAR